MKKIMLLGVTLLLLTLSLTQVISGDRVTGCGGDGEPMCTGIEPCDAFRTAHPSWENHCIACGNIDQQACPLTETTPTACRPDYEADYSNTCVAECGGDGEPMCTGIEPCDAFRTAHPNWANHCIACGNIGQQACPLTETTPTVCRPDYEADYSNTCVAECGADNQNACLAEPRCDSWATPHSANEYFCTACGGDYFPRCSLAYSASPRACRDGMAIDPTDHRRCVACGNQGQPPCRGPEPTTNNSAVVPPQQSGGPVWGWADIHEHMFANEAYGGALIWGKPFDYYGADKALAQCDYSWGVETVPSAVTLAAGFVFPFEYGLYPHSYLGASNNGGYPIHGTNGIFTAGILPTQFLYGLPVNVATANDPFAFHHTAGQTDFYRGTDATHGWPHYLDGGHQQMYYKWVQRAYEGGLRLLLDMPVNNEMICKLSIKRAGYTCNDMDAVKVQIKQMKALEVFIDLEDDNILNNSGWYRIAYSPQEARAIIESGAMAVIIGMEVDKLFDCGEPNASACSDRGYLRSKIDEVWDLGVRHLYPVHLNDNAFSGMALYNGMFYTADFVNNFNPINDWTLVEPYDCGSALQLGPDGVPVDAGYTFKLTVESPLDLPAWLLSLLAKADNEVPTSGYAADCNARGLSAAGLMLIEQLMDKGMLIDIDHFSHRALEGYQDDNGMIVPGVLDLMEQQGYPPLSSHSVITPNGNAGTEYGHTEARVKRILSMGGMVAANPPRRHGESVAVGDDPGTTIQFVEGQHLHGGTSLGYVDILSLVQQTISENNVGLTPLNPEWLDPDYPGIALAGDHGAFLNQPGPRFNHLDYHKYSPRYTGDGVAALDYPYAGLEPTNKNDPNGATIGEYSEQVTGSRRFDFNIDGLAHYGMVPDMLADIRNVLDNKREEQPDTPDMQPIMGSAEAFLRTWQRIPAFNSTSDNDGDGIGNGVDNCIYISNANQADLDSDDIGDACDTDRDGDGTDDRVDHCPATISVDLVDTDDDGVGDACPIDGDNDGVGDVTDNCPTINNPNQGDVDVDGLGDACDPDMDGDGIANTSDNCPLITNPGQEDNDSDGLGDFCDSDDDNDTVLDGVDNCPLIANPAQEDNEGDGVGDICDADDDNDQVLDVNDACPFIDASGYDADQDGCIDDYVGLEAVMAMLVSNGSVNTKLQIPLSVKIANSAELSDKGNICAALSQLHAFSQQINAQRGRNVTEEAAQLLTDYANNVGAQLTLQSGGLHCE